MFSKSPLHQLSALALLVAFALTFGACASSGTSGDAAMVAEPTATRGMIRDGDDMTNRRFRMKISFSGTSEVVTVREGQAVVYQRDDATYSLTPRISKSEIGRIEVEVERQSAGGVERTTPVFSVGEDYEVSQEIRDIEWPYLAVRVINVQPPIRRGPQAGDTIPRS